ncbi:MAG: DUF4091 domain-containing protein [Theionarchaea archaeon]|nr:DUF4091 domain-containing protein [Theionarchaea archaeon]
MIRKVGFVIVCAFFVFLQSQPEVGVTHGMQRVFLYDPVPEGREIFIQTARNEYESFQIVVKPDFSTDIAVIIQDLYDEEDNVFSRKNFTFYDVHYIYVKTPSPRSKAAPAWYPDGLSHFDGSNAEKGVNTLVWVDVYTPEDQKPGLYKGSLYVEMDSVLEIPVSIEVWNFTLPQKTSLKSGTEVVVDPVVKAHDLEWDSPEFDTILYSYYETLIHHRVMPLELYYGEPEVRKDGSITTDDIHERLCYFLDTLQVNNLIYPLFEDWPFRDPFGRNLEKTTLYLQRLYEYYKANGWEDRFVFYLIDEPNSKRDYEEVRNISRKLQEIHPNIRFMVTEQMIPDDPEWGNLLGYVDVWCPLFPYIEDEKESIKERQELGEEVWTYTALCQGEKETPFWELDFPVLNYRVTTWMIWYSHITGFVYWACNWWEGNPWENPETWLDNGDVYNGEGFLVYPGEKGCLPSIRLKALREGMEDYEYFVILESLGRESFVDEEVKKIVKSWYEWEKNPEQLLKIRSILGEEINRLSGELEQELYEEKEEKVPLVEKEAKDEKEVILDEEKDLSGFPEGDDSKKDIIRVTTTAVVFVSLAVLILILAIHSKRT